MKRHYDYRAKAPAGYAKAPARKRPVRAREIADTCKPRTIGFMILAGITGFISWCICMALFHVSIEILNVFFNARINPGKPPALFLLIFVVTGCIVPVRYLLRALRSYMEGEDEAETSLGHAMKAVNTPGRIIKFILLFFALLMWKGFWANWGKGQRVIRSGNFYFDEKGNPVDETGKGVPMGFNTVFDSDRW